MNFLERIDNYNKKCRKVFGEEACIDKRMAHLLSEEKLADMEKNVELVIQYDAVEQAYFQKFGIGYPQYYSDPHSMEWHIECMKRAIENGVPVSPYMPEVEYEY